MDKHPRAKSIDGPVRRLKTKLSSSPKLTQVEPAVAAPISSGTFTYNKSRQSRFAWLRALSWKRRIVIAVVALVAATGLYFGTKVLLAARQIITNNTGSSAPALSGQIDPSKLTHEGDGRINILLLGIGGPGHDGPNLTDTMMVVSIDPKTHDVAMLSVPRDLYVPIKGHGWTKINAAYAYGQMNSSTGGATLAKSTIQNVLDVPINYYALVDFSGFKKAVDAVGGIDITVDKPIYDTEYPNDVTGRSEIFSLKAGPQHMNGATALQYVRSRKSTSDFDRAARQQKLLIALRQKVLTLQTLSNPAKLSNLISIVGSSARTDLQPSEIQKLAQIAQQIDSTKVTTKVLDTTPAGLLTFPNLPGAGAIESPAAGIRNFSAIQDFAHTYFIDNYIKSENATIEVQNGTLRSGQATAVETQLKTYGYNVTGAVTAGRQNYTQSVIYDYSGGQKPYTINYLQNRFHATATRASRQPGDPDIRIIVGSSYTIAPLYSTL